MKRAIIIFPDGRVLDEKTDFKKFKKDYLSGGHIEMLPLTREAHAYIDEDGKSKGLEYNTKATLLCRSHRCLNNNDIIVGPMAIFGTDRDRESDVPDFVREWLGILK